MAENQQEDIRFKIAKEAGEIYRKEMEPVRKISFVVDILTIGLGYLVFKKIVKKEVEKNVLQKEKTR